MNYKLLIYNIRIPCLVILAQCALKWPGENAVPHGEIETGHKTTTFSLEKKKRLTIEKTYNREECNCCFNLIII